MLSVIVPIYNEEKYIERCIQSILDQDYPKDDLEVLFVDGMSNDKTRSIVSSYSKKYPFIFLLDNPNRIVPYAMNIGIKASKGDIIMRLDAHSFYEKDYFSVLTKRLIELDADNVGVVCKTDVLNKTPKTLAIREVLSNKFGVGNSTFRTGVSEVKEVDTVPFGCWRRDVFEKYGLFDVRLVRNQDIELSKRIINGGGKIYIVPDTYCTYLARETYRGIAKNNFGNGKWNILTVFYTKKFSSLSLRHFVPLLFVLSLIIPPFLSIFWFPFIWLSIVSLGLYCGMLGVISLKLSINKHLNFFYLIWSFMVLHLSYGFGSLVGILKLPFIK
ncbi:MAG: glycosyltransferase family 2 protein [Bacteroidales bacterium]